MQARISPGNSSGVTQAFHEDVVGGPNAYAFVCDECFLPFGESREREKPRFAEGALVHGRSDDLQVVDFGAGDFHVPEGFGIGAEDLLWCGEEPAGTVPVLYGGAVMLYEAAFELVGEAQVDLLAEDAPTEGFEKVGDAYEGQTTKVQQGFERWVCSQVFIERLQLVLQSEPIGDVGSNLFLLSGVGCWADV